jgi:hypothetical protein
MCSFKEVHDINATNCIKKSTRIATDNNRRRNNDINHSTVVSSSMKLRLRDLRRLDPYQYSKSLVDTSLAPEEKFIIVRSGCILFAFQCIHAVILSNSVFILRRVNDDRKMVSAIFSLLQGIQNKVFSRWQSINLLVFHSTASVPFPTISSSHILEEKVRKNIIREQTHQAFELTVLETLLGMQCNEESREVEAAQMELTQLLRVMGSGGGWVLLPLRAEERIARLTDRLSRLRTRVTRSLRLLADPLEDEEQMALMNLSFLASHPHLSRCIPSYGITYLC